MSYRDEVLKDAPSAYWRLGETVGTAAADSSGNGLVGVYQNAPTLGVAGAIAGDPDKAVTLNGTNQYISVVDNNLLDPGDTFTLECWVRLPIPVAGANAFLFSKGVGGYDFFIPTTGTLNFNKCDTAAIVTSTANVPVGSWVHLVVTKATTTTKLYINGVDRTGTVTNSTIVATATALSLGRQYSNSLFLLGSLDEAAIYPAALSPARVRAHTLAGTGAKRQDFGAILVGAGL